MLSKKLKICTCYRTFSNTNVSSHHFDTKICDSILRGNQSSPQTDNIPTKKNSQRTVTSRESLWLIIVELIYTNQLRSDFFYRNFYLFYKTSNPSEEDNCTEPCQPLVFPGYVKPSSVSIMRTGNPPFIAQNSWGFGVNIIES